LLRVGVLVGFQRGRLQSALALLRGANVDGDETLTEDARTTQLDKLTDAIDKVLDLTNWHEYLKTLMAAGFRRSTEISSQNSVVLVYALYLIGRHRYGLSHTQLRTTIARYFFMASLTGRYTGSFETRITADVQAATQAEDGEAYLNELRQTIDADSNGGLLGDHAAPRPCDVSGTGTRVVRLRGIALPTRRSRTTVCLGARAGWERNESNHPHQRPLRSGGPS
jgi:hypothetical protein